MSRGHIGDIEVVRLAESTVGGPMSLFLDEGSLDGSFEDVLGHRYYERSSGLTHQPSSCWLIREGDANILVDTGPGDMPRSGMREFWADWPMATAKLTGALYAEGLAPDDIDLVLLTHLHWDHIGGLMTAGAQGSAQLMFPNARHVFSRAEYEHAQDQLHDRSIPEFLRRIFQEMVEPVVAAGSADLIEGVTELTPSITAVPSPGHSPGHYRYDLSSKGEHGIFCGDQFHYPFQVTNPMTALRTAYDPSQDCDSRAQLFHDAANRGALLCPTHIHDPAVLRVRRDGGAFTYTLGW
jgi:glyoxylase-like metal-dependent hydrolase (beta-lactamase superfamily II)